MVFLRALIFFYVVSALRAVGPDLNPQLMVIRPLSKNERNWVPEVFDFEYLLMENAVIIDKSLLIKKLVESEYKVADITYPKGWGKTCNLDMTRIFLRLEANRTGAVVPLHESVAYRLFKQGELYLEGKFDSKINKPFAISKDEEFCEKHLGQHPVIYLNLGGVSGYSLDGVYGTIRDLISEAYGEHDYMLRVFDQQIAAKRTSVDQKEEIETQKMLFHRYMFGSENLTELINSMQFLSNMLYGHFGKPSYICIDDYDAPLWHILQTYPLKENDRDTFLEVFRKFMVTTFEKSPHIVKGFVTGSLKLAKDFYFPPWKSVADYHFLANELNEFYGFRDHEIDTLLTYGEAPSEIQTKFHEYYNGYGSSNDPKKRFYNGFSVLSFLHSGFQLKPYNVFPPNKPNYMQRFFEIEPFKEAVVNLLKDDVDVEISKAALGNLTISKEEYEDLKVFFLNQLKDHSSVVNAVFKIVFANGFLSLRETRSGGKSYVVKTSRAYSSSEDDKVIIKFPNKEMATEMKDQYYVYSTGQRLCKELHADLEENMDEIQALENQRSGSEVDENSENSR